jgi:hypothetical protein
LQSQNNTINNLKCHTYLHQNQFPKGHPDKVADQISDAILDHLIAADPQSKVAVETLVTTGLTVISGEVKTQSYIDVQQLPAKPSKKSAIPKVIICLMHILVVYFLPSTSNLLI